MAASPVAIGTSVFQPGPHPVDEPQKCAVDRSRVPGVPKPLMVVTPTDAGTYPVVVFLHGYLMFGSWYYSLLKHVASHGFIAVAPQLYDHPALVGGFDDGHDIQTAKSVINWLPQPHGLLYVLSHTFGLHAVRPDLTRLALAGHSRGGDTAFATALGLRGKGDDTSLELKLSALVGVDPVAGLAFGPLLKVQVEPKVLTGSFDPGMPVLVIGTGLGPEGSFIPVTLPCAPAGFNYVQFYGECESSPRYQFVAKDYGHLDMLDDGEPPLASFMCRSCKRPSNNRELCRSTMGGLMVAFLRATLEGKGEDLQAVLKNPGLAPAVVDQVKHA